MKKWGKLNLLGRRGGKKGLSPTQKGPLPFPLLALSRQVGWSEGTLGALSRERKGMKKEGWVYFLQNKTGAQSPIK